MPSKTGSSKTDFQPYLSFLDSYSLCNKDSECLTSHTDSLPSTSLNLPHLLPQAADHSDSTFPPLGREPCTGPFLIPDLDTVLLLD